MTNSSGVPNPAGDDSVEPTDGHAYAWEWFKYHADQRMKLFQFFLVLAGALAAAYVNVLNANPIVAVLISIFFLIATGIFKRFDTRNTDLIKIAEAHLKVSEQRMSAVLGSSVQLVGQADGKKTTLALKSHPKILFSYRQLVGAWYASTFVLGVLMLIVSSSRLWC